MFRANELLDLVDMDALIDDLGIECLRHGKRISIICPDHNDHNFGNCFITDHGYKCFACGSRGDAIDLVMKKRGLHFIDACKYLAKLFNCEYLLNEDSQSQQMHRPLPDKKTLTTLGISETYTIKGISEVLSENDPLTMSKEMRRFLRYEPERDGEGVYLFEEVIDRRPLQALCDDDPAMFDYIILNRAIELKKRYTSLLDYHGSINDPEIVNACDHIVNVAGRRAFLYACRRAIDQLNEILSEYGKKYLDWIKEENWDEHWQLLIMPIPDLSMIPTIKGSTAKKNMFGYLERKRIGV